MKMSKVELEPIEALKYHTSTAKAFRKLTDVEAAYLAAFIDGEGSIFIRVDNKRKYYQPIVKIGVTHPIIVDLCNRYGGIWIYDEPKKRANKPIYIWWWTSKMIRHYLPQILPFLKMKQEQAKILLRSITYCYGAGFKQEREVLKEYRENIQGLNRKPYPLEAIEKIKA